MNESCTVTQAAKLMGVSRQHIVQQIYDGNLQATRKNIGRNDYLLSPDVLTEMAHMRYKGLMSHLGVYLFATALHEMGMMTEAKLIEIGEACKTEITSLEKIDIFQPIIANIIATNPIIQQLLQDETHVA